MIFPPEPSKECVKVSHVIFECRVINHRPDERGAVNDEAEPSRRLEQDPGEWCTCENCSVMESEMESYWGKHTDC